MSKNTSSSPWDSLIYSLRRISEQLPTKEEKEIVIRNIQDMINALEQLKLQIREFPEIDQFGSVMMSLENFQKLLREARSNPRLSALLGLPSRQRISPGKRSGEVKNYQEVLNELRKLPTADIVKKLMDYRYLTVEELKILARELNIKVPDRVTRQEIVDRIIKSGFANPRGYNILRNFKQGNQNATDLERE